MDKKPGLTHQNWKYATVASRHHEASCTLKEALHWVVDVPYRPLHVYNEANDTIVTCISI